jgi:hypothetical protein
MFAAIGLFYVLGREICRRARGLDLIMIWGGVLVALSQVYPMVHFLSAGFAFRTAERLGLLESTETVHNVSGAFAGCMVMSQLGIRVGRTFPVADDVGNSQASHEQECIIS